MRLELSLENYPKSTRCFAGMIILSRLTSHLKDQETYELINNLRQNIAIVDIVGSSGFSKAYFGLEIAAIIADHSVKIADYLLGDSE